MSSFRFAELGTCVRHADTTARVLEELCAVLQQQLSRQKQLRVGPYGELLAKARAKLILGQVALQGSGRNYRPPQSGDIQKATDGIIDCLQGFAPSFCYFGLRKDNKNEWGFYFSPGALESACDAGDCVKVAERPDYLAVVSTHGQLTLYSVQLTEILRDV